jgi:hypothetical protein
MEEHGFPRPIVVRQPLYFKAYSQEQGFSTVLELMRQYCSQSYLFTH